MVKGARFRLPSPSMRKPPPVPVMAFSSVETVPWNTRWRFWSSTVSLPSVRMNRWIGGRAAGLLVGRPMVQLLRPVLSCTRATVGCSMRISGNSVRPISSGSSFTFTVVWPRSKASPGPAQRGLPTFRPRTVA